MPELRQLFRRKALVGSFFTIVLLFFSPTIVSVYWHLRYGRMIVYRGKRIPVHSRWIVEENLPQGLRLMRLPSTIVGLRTFPSSGSLSRGVPPRIPIEEAYRSFESYFWTYGANDGAVSGPLRFGEGDDEGVCMKASPKDPRSYSTIQCDLFQGSWFASFIGREKDADSFLQTVREAR
jgi:hypothetical protein